MTRLVTFSCALPVDATAAAAKPTYCTPSTVYVIGPDFQLWPVLKCHNSFSAGRVGGAGHGRTHQPAFHKGAGADH